MKGQIVSEDEEGVNKKAPALLQQLSGIQLAEDKYGIAVGREVLLFVLKLTQSAGVDINLTVAYQVETAVTEAVDTHGPEWIKDDVQWAVDVSSLLAHASFNSKRKPTETKLLFERGLSLLSHVVKVMKRVGGARDERTLLATETLKTIQASRGTKTRSRRRAVDAPDGGDESDGSVTDLFADFDRYTELVVKLADTEAPDAQFELESKILSLGFNYY